MIITLWLYYPHHQGSGKLHSQKIQQKYQSFKISVSYTTRPPRSNEVNGVDYHFVKKDEFEELIKENKLYEYAKIFENYYGTLKKMLMKL